MRGIYISINDQLRDELPHSRFVTGDIPDEETDSLNTEADGQVTSNADDETVASQDELVPISERVKFWEEQDRINQELIPRVIRQHELLTQHISEHEHLPTTLANAVEEGLARSHKELQDKYSAALESAKEDLLLQMESEHHQYRSRVGNMVMTIVAAGGIIIIAATVAFNVLID